MSISQISVLLIRTSDNSQDITLRLFRLLKKTNNMKPFLFSIAFILTLLCQAQEVLILGTVHHFKDEYKSRQNFQQVIDNLIDYNPDIICIEAIPVSDTSSLKEIWPKNMNRADSLKRALDTGKYNSLATQKQLKGAELYANYDFWNAYYQWDSIGGGSPGPFKSYNRRLTNSEYGLIVFPVARKLKKNRFLNIDYRVGEKKFLNENNKVFKKLLFKLKLKPIKSYLRIQKQYKKEHENGTLIEFVNGPVFQNAFPNLIDNLTNYLKKSNEARSVKDSWHRRNRIMAERIQKATIETNSTKVLVTVGAAHVSHIKYYLEQMGITVKTYGELLSQYTKSN